MERYNWNQLNHLQLGRYAEYFAKMEFTQFGFDVYSAEVDDKGIDFVIRRANKYYDVQVKSVKGTNYIFFVKDKFELRDNLLAVVILFQQGRLPNTYLIPSLAWSSSNELFVSRDYVGKKSKPEWGLNLSAKNMELLEQYSFERTINKI